MSSGKKVELVFVFILSANRGNYCVGHIQKVPGSQITSVTENIVKGM